MTRVSTCRAFLSFCNLQTLVNPGTVNFLYVLFEEARYEFFSIVKSISALGNFSLRSSTSYLNAIFRKLLFEYSGFLLSSKSVLAISMNSSQKSSALFSTEMVSMPRNFKSLLKQLGWDTLYERMEAFFRRISRIPP